MDLDRLKKLAKIIGDKARNELGEVTLCALDLSKSDDTIVISVQLDPATFQIDSYIEQFEKQAQENFDDMFNDIVKGAMEDEHKDKLKKDWEEDW